MTWGDVMGAIRSTAGLGKLPEDMVRRSGNIARRWIRAGTLSAEEIVWAIEGWRALTDEGATWLEPGEPFSLLALHGTRCLVEHHSGERVERATLDVALEYSPPKRRTNTVTRDGDAPESLAAVLRRVLPEGTDG